MCLVTDRDVPVDQVPLERGVVLGAGEREGVMAAVPGRAGVVEPVPEIDDQGVGPAEVGDDALGLLHAEVEAGHDAGDLDELPPPATEPQPQYPGFGELAKVRSGPVAVRFERFGFGVTHRGAGVDLVGIGVGVGAEEIQRRGVPGQVEQHPALDLAVIDASEDVPGRSDNGPAKVHAFGRLSVQVLEIQSAATGPSTSGGAEILQFIRHPARGIRRASIASRTRAVRLAERIRCMCRTQVAASESMCFSSQRRKPGSPFDVLDGAGTPIRSQASANCLTDAAGRQGSAADRSSTSCFEFEPLARTVIPIDGEPVAAHLGRQFEEPPLVRRPVALKVIPKGQGRLRVSGGVAADLGGKETVLVRMPPLARVRTALSSVMPKTAFAAPARSRGC